MLQIIMNYVSCDMKYIIDIYIRNNNQQWFTCNLLTKYWKKEMKEMNKTSHMN